MRPTIWAWSELGRFSEAREQELEGARLAASTQHAFTISVASFASCVLHFFKGEWAKVRLSSERAVTVAREKNVVLVLPTGVAFSAWSLAQLGETSDALDRVREGEQLLDRHASNGIVGWRAWDYHVLGHACLGLGQLDAARRLGDRAMACSSRHPGFAAHALHLLGEVATHPDRFDAETGAAHYGRALALAEPRGMRPLVAHCHAGLARVCRRTGHQDRADEHLAIATKMYRDMGIS